MTVRLFKATAADICGTRQIASNPDMQGDEALGRELAAARDIGRCRTLQSVDSDLVQRVSAAGPYETSANSARIVKEMTGT